MATQVYQRQVEKRASMMRWSSQGHFYATVRIFAGTCTMVGWDDGSWLEENHELREEGRLAGNRAETLHQRAHG